MKYYPGCNSLIPGAKITNLPSIFLLRSLDYPSQSLQTQQVRAPTKTRNRAHTNRGNQGPVAKILASVHIG